MFLKNEKKKSRPLLAIGVGAMAIYGAYSVVRCMKESCCEKLGMLTRVVKKGKNKEKTPSDECENGSES